MYYLYIIYAVYLHVQCLVNLLVAWSILFVADVAKEILLITRSIYLGFSEIVK